MKQEEGRRTTQGITERPKKKRNMAEETSRKKATTLIFYSTAA